MDEQMGHMIAKWDALLRRFLRRGFKCDYNVAEQWRRIRARCGREREDIGGLINPAPSPVKRANSLVIAKENADFGIGCNVAARFFCRNANGRLGEVLRVSNFAPVPRFVRNSHGRFHLSPRRARAAAASYAPTIRRTRSWRTTSLSLKTT